MTSKAAPWEEYYNAAGKLLMLHTESMTIPELVAALGVSHQRVHQLLVANNLSYKRRRLPHHSLARLTCAVCGTEFARKPAHVRAGARPCCRRKCAQQVRREPPRTDECLWCGAAFQRPRYKAQNKRAFCTWDHWVLFRSNKATTKEEQG